MGRDRCEQIITRGFAIFWCAPHPTSAQRKEKQAPTGRTEMSSYRWVWHGVGHSS